MTHTTSHIRKPFNIGAVRLPNRIVQAPLAGISGRAFRLQARRFGVALVVTEMVSSYGVRYHNARTLEMLELVEGEHPIAVQLFGSDPDVMAQAARAAQAAGADIIDVNMGCPVKKVIKTGAGVALMGDEGLAVKVVAAMVDAVGIPVTVKMRSGPGRLVTAVSLARLLEDAGAAAICIHPRTGAQMWKGKADHGLSVELATVLGIPVIASGDVNGFADARRLLESGCAAIMIGRPALGDPWLYSDLLAGDEPGRRSLDEVLAEIGIFYGDLVDEMGEARAERHMRKFYGWYLRRFRLPAQSKAALLHTQGFQEAEALIRQAMSQS
ncbi:MAG: tRNA dihydrouridine synthase DusB [Thermoleophilia bacterium]|jgi:nifR3 family TIM-barrel protein